MKRVKLLTLAALAAAALGACSTAGTGSGTPTTSPPATGRLSSTAKVAILEPETGAALQGSVVKVRISLEGGRIIQEVSSNLKPDEGHIHLLLDGKVVQLLGGLDDTIEDVADGPHLLQVEFVAADHGPFSPRVLAAVSFTMA